MRTNGLTICVILLIPSFGFCQTAKEAGVSGDLLKVDGQLTNDDPKDRIRKTSVHKVHAVKMLAGKIYTIDLQSRDFDAYLRLEDSTGKQLAEDDDSGGNLNARIVIQAPKDDTYQVIATSFKKGVGAFTLTVREGKGAAAKKSISRVFGISPDFEVYATNDEDKGIKLVDLESGKQVLSTEWDRDWGSTRSVVIGKNFVAALCYGKINDSDSIKIFSRKTGELEKNVRLPGSDFDSRLLGIIDDTHLVLKFSSGSAVLHDISVKKLDSTSMGNRRGRCQAYTEKYILEYETETVMGNLTNPSYSRIRQINIVETKTGKVVKSFKDFPKINQKESGSHMYSPAAIHTDGNLLAYGVEDSVALYDVATNKIVHKLEGHLDLVTSLAFSPNGQIVASAGKDKSVRLWKEGKEVYTIKKLSFAPFNLLFSSDGKKIAILQRSDYYVHAVIIDIEKEVK